MKKIKALVAALALAAATGTANAGIPVIDAANLANSIQQVIAWGQQYTQMVDSINQLRAQYTQLQTTYNSMTGDRGLGTLLNAPTDQAARRYLPPQGEQIDQLALGSVTGYASLQSTVASLRATISTLPADTLPSGSEALNALNAKLDSIATKTGPLQNVGATNNAVRTITTCLRKARGGAAVVDRYATSPGWREST